MIHDGHRERLRKKALDHGFNCLEEHECLELLLGYSLVRKNTNEIAHELINKAGSLKAVFEMDIADLTRVKGVGLVSAFLIKLVAHLSHLPKTPIKRRADMSRFSLVKELVSTLFAASEKEELYALYLDRKMSLIEAKRIAQGGEWQVGVSPKDILATGLMNGSSVFILAHNHPHGEAKPSRDDLDFTVRMESASNAVGLVLLEHMIYAEGDVHPIMKVTKLNSLTAIEYDEVTK